jgi:hypothetical protein
VGGVVKQPPLFVLLVLEGDVEEFGVLDVDTAPSCVQTPPMQDHPDPGCAPTQLPAPLPMDTPLAGAPLLAEAVPEVGIPRESCHIPF